MDATIQTNTPQGSPILAYGEVCPPRFGSPRRWLGGVLAGIIVLCGIFVATLFLHISFPQNAFILIGLHSGTMLTDPLPRIWQHTAETTSFPFVAGMVKQNGAWKPFTITLRGFGNSGAWTQGAGPFVLRADEPLALEQKRVKTILGPIVKLGRHSASLQISGDIIDPAFSGSLTGTIDGTTLTTDQRITTRTFVSLGAGDVVASLSALPDSWPFIKKSLADDGILIDEMPSSIAWTESTSTLPELDLSYSTAMPSSTILSFASIAGQYDSSRIQLPDGSLAEDLRQPFHVLTGTTTLRWEVSSGTTIWIDGQEAHIQTGTVRPQAPSSCSGTILARFSEHALQKAAKRLNYPQGGLRSLQLAEHEGRLVVCWE